ncbi:MAG: M20 family metallopeptidase [Deltaproteobacteria bacterium]|nr:M20 family metallopeptidase [Deltaproteobacteria bacterium]
MMAVHEKIGTMIEDLTRWRRELHTCPETAFSEAETSAYVAEKLLSFGLDVDRGLAGTGIVATIRRGEGDRPAIGLRSDMDALDITEATGLPYASRNEGKMHACGHDGHMVMLLGAARYLAENDTFRGTVHFIFQPAEENEGGGGRMVREGLFERFPVRSVFAMHNFPVLKEGTFAICKGPMMAAYDVFDIRITGRGGHAATPQNVKDPILASAYLVNLLQSVVSRDINPTQAAVVSVTEIHGGTSYNIIPDTVSLRGTTRHFLTQVQDRVESRIREICAGLSASFDIAVNVTYERRYPPLVNTDRETEEAIRAAILVSGSDRVLTDIVPVMTSEDFAFMLKERPGAYMGIGAGRPRENGFLHQAKYDFNDRILPIGASYWATLVETVLPKTS